MKVLARNFLLLFTLGFAGQAIAQTSLGTLFEGPRGTSSSSAAITAAKVNQMGARDNRYRAADDFRISDYSVFGNQPQYNLNPEMLSGYGLATAGELRITKAWNELPNNRSVLVELNPNARVRYLGNLYYLDDCQWFVGGKWVQFYNRLKPVEVPAPKPEVRVEYRDRIVEKPVEKIVEKIEYRDRLVPAKGCPVNVKFDLGTPFWSGRVWGGIKNTFWPIWPNGIKTASLGIGSGLLSFYKSVGFIGRDIAFVRAYQNAIMTTGGNVALNGVNPKKIEVDVEVGEREVAKDFKRHKGDEYRFDGGRLAWLTDDVLQLYVANGDGGEIACQSLVIDDALNAAFISTWEMVREIIKKGNFIPPLNTGRPKT